jgi:uncharacterized membrane protein (UPF0127 family)
MTNKERRRIVDQAKASGYKGSYVDLFRQAEQPKQPEVAETPEQKREGLRPAHKAGNTDTSMVFKDVPPHTPFNTVGMKAPIDIKKYDSQGHLVKSYESVPPGIQSLDTGPAHGQVIESPAKAQKGGFRKAQGGLLGDIKYLNPATAFPTLVGDMIKENIVENIQPYGSPGYYKGSGENDPEGEINRLFQAGVLDKPEEYSYRGSQLSGRTRSDMYKERTDLFSMSLLGKQKYGVLEESQFKPTKGDNDDVTYYSSQVTEDYINDRLKAGDKPKDIIGVGYHGRNVNNVLGNYTIDMGEDDQGQYLSYYDRWDLNPLSAGNAIGSTIENVIQSVAGINPPEVYGRVYYNRKKHGGYRLPKYQKGDFKPKDINATQIGFGFYPDIPKGYKLSADNNLTPENWSEYHEEDTSRDIDLPRLKKGLRYVESSDGQNMVNPESSATGLYGQRFSEIDGTRGFTHDLVKEGMTRSKFAADTTLQNKIFEQRVFEGLGKEKSTQTHVNDLFDEYEKQLGDKWTYSANDIASLVNLLGREGTRRYLGYVVRDGKPLSEVFPDKYGPKAGQTNKTPEEYMRLVREHSTGKKRK